MYSLTIAVAATAGHYWPSWQASLLSEGSLGWTGRSWTGTRHRSNFMKMSMQKSSAIGCRVDWLATLLLPWLLGRRGPKRHDQRAEVLVGAR